MSILAVRDEDGSVQELVRKPGERSVLLAEWAPGDDALVYAESAGTAGWRLYRVPLTGGQPVEMKVTIDPGRLRVTHHPNGRALTYASGMTAFEVWVMRGIAR